MSNNNCNEESNLSLGTGLLMDAGARLWLKSSSDKAKSSSFQIICQNRSVDPLLIEVSSAFIPWIKLKNAAKCDNWVGDRLTCTDINGGSPILYCAIALIKSLDVDSAIQRKTSVTMRGVNEQGNLPPLNVTESQKLANLIEFLKPEVDLCKKVLQTDEAIDITWTIQSDGRVVNAHTKKSHIQTELADCALEAVKHFNFPDFSRDIQISYTF